MKRWLLGLFSLMFTLPLVAAEGADPADTIDEGIEYQRVVPAMEGGEDGKVQVVEMFWYGCPHCYQFEPSLNRWLANAPENVEFVRIPAVVNPSWAFLGKAYYTAEILGVVDKIHAPLFHAIHAERKRFNDVDTLAAFFENHAGVSRADFDKTFNSFAVDSKVRRAAMLGERYGITGVPSVIINGKYRSSGVMTGGYGRLLQVMDHLIAKESAGS